MDNAIIDLTKPVQTREGDKVELWDRALSGHDYPLLGVVIDNEGKEVVETWTLDGRYHMASGPRDDDLINAPGVPISEEEAAFYGYDGKSRCSREEYYAWQKLEEEIGRLRGVLQEYANRGAWLSDSEMSVAGSKDKCIFSAPGNGWEAAEHALEVRDGTRQRLEEEVKDARCAARNFARGCDMVDRQDYIDYPWLGDE